MNLNLILVLVLEAIFPLPVKILPWIFFIINLLHSLTIFRYQKILLRLILDLHQNNIRVKAFQVMQNSLEDALKFQSVKPNRDNISLFVFRFSIGGIHIVV